MKNTLTIKDVMHPFPHSIGVKQPLSVAKEMLQEHNIRHLPVQEANQVKGIITERDIHFAVAVDKKEPEEILVQDAYTAEPYIVTPDTPLDKVARYMAHEHLGCALIVEHNRLIGIFTTTDACRTLAETLSGSMEQ